MKRHIAYRRGSHTLATFRRDESGATLVEFALVLALFLLIYFGTIDFGRLAFHYVTAEKAMHSAARLAAVRPPACDGVPEFHQSDPLNTGTGATDYGTRCNAGANICLAVGTVSCSGNLNNPTVAEIWPMVRGTLPNTAGPEDLRFSYTYDSNLGFLGGPYVPVVTVELQNITFQFVSPLGALARLAGATNTGNLGADIAFPAMSVSMPGEDLAHGA
ncbi:TadE/TadG family type IV pilus assembly protein [Aliiruegeria lutimaris]|uniref:Flp pilus assembly protein TadG n=1 Tax=Aliiruegeria lutimaris TaxID=571298 RepID=A0A1G9JXQ5_9RHOB|nr:TadE/TadG family type IV pilus assembly protein [Aliiruegeria lutimaris]SDL41996.1 Flp pilus assembly protein TadG [Aliiruegeria lutimaris]